MQNSNTNHNILQSTEFKISDLDLEKPHKPVQNAIVAGAMDIGPLINSDQITFGDISTTNGSEDFMYFLECLGSITRLIKYIPKYPVSVETFNENINRKKNAGNQLSEMESIIRGVHSKGGKITYSLHPTIIMDENQFGQYGRDGWICSISLGEAQN